MTPQRPVASAGDMPELSMRAAVGITTAFLAACANPRPEPTPAAAVPASESVSPKVVATEPEAASAPGPFGVVATPPEDRGAYVALPDGTFAPALNGVRNAPAMVWTEDEPFAPIVGKETYQGVEWYTHADGSKSTTSKVFRADLGRDDAVTQVATPRRK